MNKTKSIILIVTFSITLYPYLSWSNSCGQFFLNSTPKITNSTESINTGISQLFSNLENFRLHQAMNIFKSITEYDISQHSKARMKVFKNWLSNSNWKKQLQNAEMPETSALTGKSAVSSVFANMYFEAVLSPKRTIDEIQIENIKPQEEQSRFLAIEAMTLWAKSKKKYNNQFDKEIAQIDWMIASAQLNLINSSVGEPLSFVPYAEGKSRLGEIVKQ